ncbi:MAG: LLM class F420-dependent oxidoreductase [Deltaproteobacteria bacterium]|nr:LLM class F420-dependent oxidoreductase [Deltaproteobacteria bacterium]
MKLGLQLGYWMTPPDPGDKAGVAIAQEAERLGFDSVWTAEAYGSDCFSPLCWIGAHTSRIRLGTAVMQLSARSPASAAMTAMTIDHLSGGRLVLGVGVSGPQVVEGWYGQPFPRPLERTREWVELFRRMIARQEPVAFQGRHYQLPIAGGTGLGKPLKLINAPLRDTIPVYIGAEGPKNVAQTLEIADGWLPLFFSPYRTELYREALAKRKPGFEIACTVTTIVTPDVRAGLGFVKTSLGFYLGGMGAREKNFHLDLARRLGWGPEAEKVQELFLAGRRAEAFAAVPEEMADEISLVGPPERIRERLQVWSASPVTTLMITAREPATLRLFADALR